MTSQEEAVKYSQDKTCAWAFNSALDSNAQQFERDVIILSRRTGAGSFSFSERDQIKVINLRDDQLQLDIEATAESLKNGVRSK